ncbi:hypothetical protein OESDEN_24126 [Oesophagostomum dentatum]|uniref:Uncharacterized protein n=1 Tax=Oesophagostomum dentatum TaxID=61180 RepID=A0A0B1RU81_OESDE|nr:hypothetical protein OESDEN_24126 [Oesophagostomum dentatum]
MEWWTRAASAHSQISVSGLQSLCHRSLSGSSHRCNNCILFGKVEYVDRRERQASDIWPAKNRRL